MRKKSAKTETAVRAAVILEEHFATLPKQKESKARKDLHRLATIVSRRAPGKLHDLSEARRIVVQSARAQKLHKFSLRPVVK